MSAPGDQRGGQRLGGHLGRDPLNGSLVNAGTVISDRRSQRRRPGAVGGGQCADHRRPSAVQGEGAVGVKLGDVDGQVLLQNAIIGHRLPLDGPVTDAVRAKLDTDDLKQGGAAVRITGNVGKGVLLDRQPTDTSTTDTDEDDDGVDDSLESTAALTSSGPRRRWTSARSAPRHWRGGNRRRRLRPGQSRQHHRQRRQRRLLGDGDPHRPSWRRDDHRRRRDHIQAGTVTATAFGAAATGILVNPGAVVASCAIPASSRPPSPAVRTTQAR
jgi:hypothetical protein